MTDINAALDGMVFTPTNDFNGVASIRILTDDQGNSGIGGALTDDDTINITVTPVNDAPVITGGPDTSGLAETNSGLTDSGTLTVSDADLTDNVTAAVDSVGQRHRCRKCSGHSDQCNLTRLPDCHAHRDSRRYRDDRHADLEFQQWHGSV